MGGLPGGWLEENILDTYRRDTYLKSPLQKAFFTVDPVTVERR
jgi:hypothetical protein